MSEAFPPEDAAVTQLLVVGDVQRSKAFYVDVLGAELYREYGGDSVVLRFLGMWLLLVHGGPPTVDKPDVTFTPPADPSRVDHQLTIRVPDCRAAFAELQSRGADFLTPPHDRGGVVRCFFRDPDGHLLEISEVG
jgi:catechol 2,3-dioxygenase-like lactoylglutathione lyase family enzyme